MTISRRVVAWLCALALLAALAPMVAIATKNHPFYDDFGFTLGTSEAWREQRSVGATLKAALDNTVSIRQTWEGTYATSFIGALQPGVFGEDLYWLTTVVLLGGLLLSLWFFLRQALCGVMQIDGLTAFTAACALGFLATQFAPNAAEGFYWWNGGTAYTLLWSFTLLTAGLWLWLERLPDDWRTAPAFALVLLATLIVGGAKYSTVLPACLAAVCRAVWAFCRRRPKRWLYLALTAALLSCLLFSAKAPGNAVRAATLTGGMGMPKAVLQAVYFGVAKLGDFVSLPVIAALIAMAAVAAPALQSSRFTFPHPVWSTLLCAALFCAQLAPTLYTGNYLGDGRTIDTYWYTFLVMALLLTLYWTGWLLKRPGMRTASKRLRFAPILLAALLLIVGCVAYHPEGAASYGPQNMTGGSALRSLVNGQAERYDQAMDAREKLLNDPSQPEVALPIVRDAPDVFMGDALASPQAEYVRDLYAEYYRKTAVTIVETE